MARTEGNRALEIGLREGTPSGLFGHPIPPGKSASILARVAHAATLAEERKQSGGVSNPKPPNASWVSSPRVLPSAGLNARNPVVRPSGVTPLERSESSKSIQAPKDAARAAGPESASLETSTNEDAKAAPASEDAKGKGEKGAQNATVPMTSASMKLDASSSSTPSDGNAPSLATPIPNASKSDPNTALAIESNLSKASRTTDVVAASSSSATQDSTVFSSTQKPPQTTNLSPYSSIGVSSNMPSATPASQRGESTAREVKFESSIESRVLSSAQSTPMDLEDRRTSVDNRSASPQPSLPAKSSFSSVPLPKSAQRSDTAVFISEKPDTFKSLNSLTNPVNHVTRGKPSMEDSSVKLTKHVTPSTFVQANQINRTSTKNNSLSEHNQNQRNSSLGTKRIGRPPGSTSINKLTAVHSPYASPSNASSKKRKPALSEKDVNILLSRYSEEMILNLLREIARSVGTRLDWEGIRRRAFPSMKCVREIQSIWRFMAYHSSLLDPDTLSEGDLPLDDESDLEDDMDIPLGANSEILSEVSSFVKADMQKFGISLNAGSSSFRKKGEKSSKSKLTSASLHSSTSSSVSPSVSAPKSRMKSPLKSHVPSESKNVPSLISTNVIPTLQTTAVGSLSSNETQHANNQLGTSSVAQSPCLQSTYAMSSSSSSPSSPISSTQPSQINKPSPSSSSTSLHPRPTHQELNQTFHVTPYSTSVSSSSVSPSPSPSPSSNTFPSPHISLVNSSPVNSSNPFPSLPSSGYPSLPEFPIIQQRRKRKLWSFEEDQALIAAIEQYGEGQWGKIVKGDFGFQRTPSQIAQRWALIRRRQEKEMAKKSFSSPSPPSTLSPSPTSFESSNFHVFPSSDSLNLSYPSSYVLQNTNANPRTVPDTCDTKPKVETANILATPNPPSLPAQQNPPNQQIIQTGQQSQSQDSRSYSDTPFPVLPHPALKSGTLRKGKSVIYNSATSAPRLRPPVTSQLGKITVPSSTMESTFHNPIAMHGLPLGNASNMGLPGTSMTQPRMGMPNQRLGAGNYVQGKFIAPGAKVIGAKTGLAGSGSMDVWNNPAIPGSGVNHHSGISGASVRGRLGVGSGPDPAVQAAAVAAGARIAPASEAVSFFKANKGVSTVFTSNMSSSTLASGMSGSTWYGTNQGEGTVVHYICTGIGGNTPRLGKNRNNDPLPKSVVNTGIVTGLPPSMGVKDSGKDSTKDASTANVDSKVKEVSTESQHPRPNDTLKSSFTPAATVNSHPIRTPAPFPTPFHAPSPMPSSAPPLPISAPVLETASSSSLSPAPLTGLAHKPRPATAPIPAHGSSLLPSHNPVLPSKPTTAAAVAMIPAPNPPGATTLNSSALSRTPASGSGHHSTPLPGPSANAPRATTPAISVSPRTPAPGFALNASIPLRASSPSSIPKTLPSRNSTPVPASNPSIPHPRASGMGPTPVLNTAPPRPSALGLTPILNVPSPSRPLNTVSVSSPHVPTPPRIPAPPRAFTSATISHTPVPPRAPLPPVPSSPVFNATTPAIKPPMVGTSNVSSSSTSMSSPSMEVSLGMKNSVTSSEMSIKKTNAANQGKPSTSLIPVSSPYQITSIKPSNSHSVKPGSDASNGGHHVGTNTTPSATDPISNTLMPSQAEELPTVVTPLSTIAVKPADDSQK